MRKILLVAALFLLALSVLFFFSREAGAACFAPNDIGLCDTGVTCVSGQCCDTIAECNNPTATPSPKVTPSANDPTCAGGTGINTAIGCIPINDSNAFIGFILRWVIGIGGGIAFLLIVYAGFMIMSSSGNPERLKAGQELLTSAIAGLIMLIFSVFILKVIGIDILGLGPLGFGK